MMKSFITKSMLKQSLIFCLFFKVSVYCAGTGFVKIFNLEKELPAVFDKVYKTEGSETLLKEGDLLVNEKPKACFFQFKPKNIDDKFLNLIVFEDISPEEMKEFTSYYASISNQPSERTDLLSSLIFKMEQTDSHEEYVHINKLFSCGEYLEEHKDQDFILAGKRNGAALALLFKALFQPHAKEHQFKLILFQTPGLETSFSNFLQERGDFRRSYEDIMMFSLLHSVEERLEECIYKNYGMNLGIPVQIEWDKEVNQLSLVSRTAVYGSTALAFVVLLPESPFAAPFFALGAAAVGAAASIMSHKYFVEPKNNLHQERVVDAYLRAKCFVEQGTTLRESGLIK